MVLDPTITPVVWNRRFLKLTENRSGAPRALGAPDPVRPAKIPQVVLAGVFATKTLYELGQGQGPVLRCQRHLPSACTGGCRQTNAHSRAHVGVLRRAESGRRLPLWAIHRRQVGPRVAAVGRSENLSSVDNPAQFRT